MALYRPGPMDNISLYLKNKNNPSSIPYLNDAVHSCLKETYGIMIYQEQIMKIAQTVASFSLGKADILRKAISKKKEDEMKRLKKDFLSSVRLFLNVEGTKLQKVISSSLLTNHFAHGLLLLNNSYKSLLDLLNFEKSVVNLLWS